MIMKYVDLINLPSVTVSEDVKKRLQSDGTTLTGSTQIVTNVVVKLAIKNPTWKFVVSGTRYSKDKELATDAFQVFDGREQLGSIQVSWHQNKEAVCIANPRVGRDMDRYDGRTTTKEAVALKHVEKYFYPKTTDENIDANIELAYSTIDNAERNIRNELYESKNNMEAKIQEFILANWDDFINAKTLDNKAIKFPSLVKEYSIINKLDANKGMATVIMLVGKEYVMKKDGIVTRGAELDEELRTKIGMLKLLDDEAFNTNIGIKVNSGLFVLI